jgi:Lrp/AsnC family transcriptional regulator, leucine-responsive regulatory protein
MRPERHVSQQMTNLDDIDHRILRELSRDARQPNLSLADRVGLSPSACLRRVQGLEKAGIIKSYRAVLDPAKLGIGFVAYVTVGLGSHTKAAQEAFERAASRAPEVRECHNITGTVEYLLRVECADLAAYKHWHTDVLGTLPQVQSITTFVVMGSPKDDRA